MTTSPCLSAKTGILSLTVPYVSHSSEILVDLTEFYKFIKQHHKDSDKNCVPRRNNIRAEISKYSYGVEEKDSATYLSLGAILRYCCFHSDDFSICKNVIDDTTKALVQQASTTGAHDVDTSDKTTFQLYKEISSSVDIISIGGTSMTDPALDDSNIESINVSYRDAFTVQEWKRIQLFEFQFSILQRDSTRNETTSEHLYSLVGSKWSFWDNIKMSLNVGEQIQKLNTRVCSYQRERMNVAEAIEGVSLMIANVQHLPGVIEEAVTKVFSEYQINGMGNVIAVDCSEVCCHQEGIHIFLESSQNINETSLRDISAIIRSSLRNHADIMEIVYVKASALSQFCKDTEKARFTLRDKFIQKKLNDEILHVDRDDNANNDSQDEEDHHLCSICFRKFSDWLDCPLSVSSHDQLSEWLLFVPLPVRLLLEKAFLNANSLKNAQNATDLIRSKIPRLSSIYEASLNTFNKNYFGPTQEMNTAELVVNYHNATTVFGIAQSSGISMSLFSAEKRLKKQANKERLYFQTYLKQHLLEYEALTDGSVQPHAISLRDCHLIFLVDNLVRTQKKRDPESGRMKSIQLCTLPITVKGLPRNSKVTDIWHTNNCDGSDNCSCKDKIQIPKSDIFETFLSYTEDEMTQMELLRHEAVWGMNYLLQHSLVRPIMDSAAEVHHPLNTIDVVTEDLAISFHDMSLQEVDGIDGDESALEKSISGMSLGEYTDPDQYNNPGQLANDRGEPACDSQDDDYENYNSDDDDDGNSEPDTDTSGASLKSSLYSDPEFTDSEDMVSGRKIELFEPGTSENQPGTYPETDIFMNSPSIGQIEGNSDDFVSAGLNIEEGENEMAASPMPTENSVSSFVKYEVPALLCRHPPPAVGRDDDINVLRNILDELIIKSGHFMHSNPNKEKILFALDHKIASNIFKLMDEPHFQCLLPEFPVLHLLKSKITNLISAYDPAGIRGLLKYMKDDDEETDWKKLVSLAEIECAARNIRRLSLSLHIAMFATYLKTLTPIESDNVLEDLQGLSLQEVEQRWGTSYDTFIQLACANNATFRLHFEIMAHCDEIVGIQLAERIGGQQGYNLLLALVKTSLPFSFLNGASSYAGFCVKLLYEHYQSSYFHKCMKESLFTTPHKGFASNFALDAQREMDHRDAIKSFRSSGSIESILPRMSVIDDLQAIRKVRSAVYQNSTDKTTVTNQENHYLGKTISEKDLKFASRCAQMILRKDILSTAKDSVPKNMYQKNPQPLTECILDSVTKEIGNYLIKKYICKIKLGGTDSNDCPDVQEIHGPRELVKKVKMSKGTTIQRRKCKANAQKTEKELIEEKRKKDMKKLNKLSLHCSSVMNTCQAIVNPDGSKRDTNKSKGMRDAIAYVLCHKQETETPPPPKETLTAMRERRNKLLEEDGLVYFQCSNIPSTAVHNIKVATVEFAGVKFWAFAKSGREYLNFIQNGVLPSIFREFKNTQHIIICEEKYAYTPDTFKALTREKREKEDTIDVSHLKSNDEMLSMDTYNRAALTKTTQGKQLASSFLAANIHEMKISKKCTIDVDSEHLISECICLDKSEHETRPCKQYAIPIRAMFGEDGVHLETKPLTSVRQRKGEAELPQADWLPFIVPELDEGDAVLSYVTSGDIDALPIHILAVSEFWPRLPNKKFKHDVFLFLKKPKKDMMPDLYCVTKIVESLEAQNINPNIGVIVSLVLCLGGNDYIPKFYEVTHLQWMMTIIEDKTYCDGLFKVERNRQTCVIERVELNEEIYLSIIKKIYCPRHLCHEKLGYEEIRQISIKLPKKQTKDPPKWLPPLSAIKKVMCLIQSQIDYLLTVCKPEADLPDFIGNGGLRRTKEGDIMYDLGEDVRYSHEKELTIIPDEVMTVRIRETRKPTNIQCRKKKRDLSESPKKEDDKGAKRTLYTSTPRKIKELKMKTQGKCEEGAVPENVAFDDDGMDGFQPIEEEEDDL